MRSAHSSLKFVSLALIVVPLSIVLFIILHRDSKSGDEVDGNELTPAMISDQTALEETTLENKVVTPDSVRNAKPETDSTNWPNAFTNPGSGSNQVTTANKRQEQREAAKSAPIMPNPARTNIQELTPIEWVWIPPGKFIMGSPEKERGRRSHEPQNEGPQTEVTIQNGFWLDKYEVTLGQFREVTGNAPRRPYPWRATDLNQPFANASWNEAMKFCAALTMRESESGRLPNGYVCRLPTEAEWEYACRAGSVTPYSFGDDDMTTLIGAFAWFKDNSDGIPHHGGDKIPNSLGLFDMHGNVAEWCLDFLGTYPGGSITNPVGTIGGPLFVIRGGSWLHPADACRSAWRHAMLNSDKYGTIEGGFRVAVARPEKRVNP